MEPESPCIGKTLSKLTGREKFIILVDNEPLQKVDAIILLEGDGFFRIAKAKELLHSRMADLIVVSGGVDNPEYGSFAGLAEELEKQGVQKNQIIVEDKSQHTKEQAEQVLNLATEKGWTKILLVASHFHQYRAFLTFLKAMSSSDQKIMIINAAVHDLPWFKENAWGKRYDLLEKEFEKIEKYQQSGDVAGFREAIEYQQWKEARRYE